MTSLAGCWAKGPEVNQKYSWGANRHQRRVWKVKTCKLRIERVVDVLFSRGWENGVN